MKKVLAVLVVFWTMTLSTTSGTIMKRLSPPNGRQIRDPRHSNPDGHTNPHYDMRRPGRRSLSRRQQQQQDDGSGK